MFREQLETLGIECLVAATSPLQLQGKVTENRSGGVHGQPHGVAGRNIPSPRPGGDAQPKAYARLCPCVRDPASRRLGERRVASRRRDKAPWDSRFLFSLSLSRARMRRERTRAARAAALRTRRRVPLPWRAHARARRDAGAGGVCSKLGRHGRVGQTCSGWGVAVGEER